MSEDLSKSGVSILSDIINILEKKECFWWLEAGTCLGAIREKNFIGHDIDIDIGINTESFSWDILVEAVKKGFTVYQIYGMRHLGLEVSLMRDGVKVDIFVFYRKEDKRWMGCWKNGGRNGMSDLVKLVFDAELMEKTLWMEFLGLSVRVPFDTIRYLVARYGESWQTPDMKWNWATSPKCIDNNFHI
jgi:iron(III) transport system permease protein